LKKISVLQDRTCLQNIMSKTKDITKFSAEQLQEFLMAFDIVMCDIDGEQYKILFSIIFNKNTCFMSVPIVHS